MSERAPYIPSASEWRDTFNILCTHCRHMPGCDVIERMIECKDGGPWPEGGWCTDPGAEVSCLSYETQDHKRLSRPVLKRLVGAACEMCDGCAARKGSEASVALHTQRDFKAAVNGRFLFTCHKPENNGRPCGGWAEAVTRKRTGAPQ